MTPPSSVDDRLATLLASAFRSNSPIAALPPDLVPENELAAYRVQEQVLAILEKRAGGWKIGAKLPGAAVSGAPLAADGLHPSPARLRCADFPGARVRLELEVAFRFGRRFAPSAQPYSAEAVEAGISEVFATIELVASRYAAWPDVDKLAQLGDLQNHGALVMGPPVRYDAALDVVSPTFEFLLDGVDICKPQPGHAAGDPSKLLAWVVNHCTLRGKPFPEGMVVTTGSCSGIHLVQGPRPAPSVARGVVGGLPPVVLQLD